VWGESYGGVLTERTSSKEKKQKKKRTNWGDRSVLREPFGEGCGEEKRGKILKIRQENAFSLGEKGAKMGSESQSEKGKGATTRDDVQKERSPTQEEERP